VDLVGRREGANDLSHLAEVSRPKNPGETWGKGGQNWGKKLGNMEKTYENYEKKWRKLMKNMGKRWEKWGKDAAMNP